MAKSHRRESGDHHERRKAMRDEQERLERKQRKGRHYIPYDLEEEDEDADVLISSQSTA